LKAANDTLAATRETNAILNDGFATLAAQLAAQGYATGGWGGGALSAINGLSSFARN
jgi:hypothetical protein